MTTIYKRLNPITGEWEVQKTMPNERDEMERARRKLKNKRHPPRPPDYGMGCQPDWLSGNRDR